MSIRSGARYFIRNVKGGTVIDLSGSDNESIIGYPKNGGENQQWELEEVHGGWLIRSHEDGRFLALEGTPHDDLEVTIRDELSYIWEIVDDNEIANGYRICVPGSNQNIDLKNHGDETPGTPIAVFGRWNGTNQIWFFEEVQYHRSAPVSLLV